MKLPQIAQENENAQNETTPVVKGTRFKQPGAQEQTDFFAQGSAAEATMPKQKKSLKGLWITLIIIFVLLVGAYSGFAVYFMSHFTFNTSVNGTNVAFQTTSEVNEGISAEVASYSLEIEGRDQNATITADTIQLRHIDDGGIDSLLTQQNEWLWPLTLIPGNESSYEYASVEFDEQQLTSALEALPLMDEEQMTAPSNAKLGFENGAYVVIPGEDGTTLDKEKTLQVVKTAVDEGKTTVNLDEANAYISPETAADDGQLAADRDLFNTYVPFQITYTLGDRTEILDGYTTINWVDTNSGVAPELLDEASVRAWVAQFASTYDTLGATRTIVNGFGEEKQVTGGTYGWQLDQEAEYWAIQTAYQSHVAETREPLFVGRAASLGAQDWGNTYLEVDISHQHMWYYIDGVCVIDTDVVTGNPNNNYATPEGVWYVYSKSYGVMTRGPKMANGEYEWEQWVDYWMPFTPDGCGFHDAPWQPSFGGTRYLTNGSHGCINMPPELAAQLIELLEPGTPVITHH